MTYVLGARAAATAPPSEAGAIPRTPPTRPPSQDRAIDLLGVNGDVIRLTDPTNGLKVLADPPPVGFWMPDYNRTLHPTPGVDGARYGDVTALPRTVGLTVRYRTTDVPTARGLTNRIAAALNPKHGLAGYLVTEADNTKRMVAGQYMGGGGRIEHLRTFGNWRIDLDCADIPYWLDAPGSELPTRTWSAPAPVDYYPYLPTNLVEDSAIGDPIPIDNNGHEDISPDWLIHGPASGALFANDTTGEQLRWTGALAAGKWLAFITQPGMQEVVDSDDVARFHELDQDPEPAFWTLARGVNIVRTVIDGIAPGTTSVMLLPQQRRWLVQG